MAIQAIQGLALHHGGDIKPIQGFAKPLKLFLILEGSILWHAYAGGCCNKLAKG